MPRTKLQAFKERWAGGCGSSLCAGARRVVLFRGTVPCDVLFTGEGPGISEDVTGYPFVGPAGQLLEEEVIAKVRKETWEWSYALTNLVGCIPLDVEGNTEQPHDKDVKKCSTRLKEFGTLCRPKLVVAVGSLARDWLDPKVKDFIDLRAPVVAITHPAAVLRAQTGNQGLMLQRCRVVLLNAVEEHLQRV